MDDFWLKHFRPMVLDWPRVYLFEDDVIVLRSTLLSLALGVSPFAGI